MEKKIITSILIIVIVMILLFSIISFFIDNKACDKFVSILSIFGTCASLIGIGLTYKQILSVKEVSEAIKINVDNSLSEINEFLSFSDITTTIKQIHEIQIFIQQSKPELALIRMRDIHLKINEIRFNKRLKIYFNEESVKEIVINIGFDITTIGAKLINDRKKVKFDLINEHLENAIHCLEEISSQLKNKKT